MGVLDLDPDGIDPIGRIEGDVAGTGWVVVRAPIDHRIFNGRVGTRIPVTGHPIGIVGVAVPHVLGTVVVAPEDVDIDDPVHTGRTDEAFLESLEDLDVGGGVIAEHGGAAGGLVGGMSHGQLVLEGQTELEHAKHQEEKDRYHDGHFHHHGTTIPAVPSLEHRSTPQRWLPTVVV